MPDYKKMYLTLMRSTEKAINTLIDAQRECEEIYIETSDPELAVMKFKEKLENKKQG